MGVALGQVNILDVYYRDLLHLILYLTWTVGHHADSHKQN